MAKKRKKNENKPKPIDYSYRNYSGLDGDAYYQHDLEKWAAEKPQHPGVYDGPPPSEDSMAFYNDALRKWAQRAPNNTQDY